MAKARGGGATVPQYYLDLLKKAADWGAIAHFVDEVCDVQELDGAHRVAFNKSEPLRINWFNTWVRMLFLC